MKIQDIKKTPGKIQTSHKPTEDPLMRRGASAPFGAGRNFAHMKLATGPRPLVLHLKLMVIAVCLGAFAFLAIHTISANTFIGNARNTTPPVNDIWAR